MTALAIIGYQGTTVPEFLATLRDAGVELVDVRAVASSRRPGFFKSALAANLASVGIFEHDPAHCHRSRVAADLARLVPFDVVHLRPAAEED